MALIDTELAEMLTDCHAQFGDTVTITIATDGAFNSTSLTRSEGTATAAVSAMRAPRRVDLSGRADITSATYRIRVTDAAAIRRGYKITDGTETYWVHAAEKEVNDLEWVVFCRTTRPA